VPERYERSYEVLMRGTNGGGVHAEYREKPEDRHSVSVTVYATRLSPYLGDLREGGVVVDLWRCDWDRAAHVVISGPMLGLHLEPAQVDACPTPSGIMTAAMSEDPGNPFGALAAAKLAKPEWSGLDYVDLQTWLQLRREIGARIGRRHRNTIEWEDGARTVIPSCEDRYRGIADVDLEAL